MNCSPTDDCILDTRVVIPVISLPRTDLNFLRLLFYRAFCLCEWSTILIRFTSAFRFLPSMLHSRPNHWRHHLASRSPMDDGKSLSQPKKGEVHMTYHSRTSTTGAAGCVAAYQGRRIARELDSHAH